MRQVLDCALEDRQAALWFVGQAGYLGRAGKVTVVIDPYLTDSVGLAAPDFSRAISVPIEPEDLRVDIFIVTHDHGDHLDPETVRRYRHKRESVFVAPHLAAKRLIKLGVPNGQVISLSVGETADVKGVSISGIFALPTGPDVLDTTGYLVRFPNGRSFYHASDTAFCELLLSAAPKAEVLMVPINGKWGNLNLAQALELARATTPRFVLPNHYDMMRLNAENPEAFRYLCEHSGLDSKCVISPIMEPFIWE